VTRFDLPRYAILLARAAATRSEDPFLKVGCALIRYDKTVAATGYNGPPAGVDIDWSDRDQRRGKIIHAEANALRYVRPGEVGFLATTTMPCAQCVPTIASYAIGQVYYAEELPSEYHDNDAVRALARALGVTMTRVEEDQ
jgi:dCMP deaminase